MIRLYMHGSDRETREAGDDYFDLTPLGVRHDDRNDAGVKTGEWTLIPWSSIKEVRRFKNPPKEKTS